MSAGQLAEELRELRERTQLSLAALATRTPYSKSSWERYLNGKKPVPRQAVEALCTLADEPASRLLALWELADAGWSGRARSASAPVVEVEQPGVRRWSPALALTVAALTVAAVVVVLGLLMGGGGTADERDADPPPSRIGCRGTDCEGKDPARMGCGGAGMVATPVKGTASGGQRLEVRYGRPCHAVWARVTGLQVGERVEVLLPGGRSQQVTARSARDAGRYLATPMTAADDPAGTRVCLAPARGGVRECFG